MPYFYWKMIILFMSICSINIGWKTYSRILKCVDIFWFLVLPTLMTYSLWFKTTISLGYEEIKRKADVLSSENTTMMIISRICFPCFRILFPRILSCVLIVFFIEWRQRWKKDNIWFVNHHIQWENRILWIMPKGTQISFSYFFFSGFFFFLLSYSASNSIYSPNILPSSSFILKFQQ